MRSPGSGLQHSAKCSETPGVSPPPRTNSRRAGAVLDAAERSRARLAALFQPREDDLQDLSGRDPSAADRLEQLLLGRGGEPVERRP